ncbi:unnamed protein product [Cochlearia groenlandica]
MDSSNNLHQLQDQIQFVGSSSSSSLDNNNSDPSCYGASSAHHQWSPGGISLNSVSLSQNYSNEMLNTRDHNNNTSECMSLSNINNHSLIQQQDNFPLQWPHDHHHHHHDQSSYHHHHHHHHHDHEGLHKIKEELSSSTTSHDHHQQGMPKFTDMLNNTPMITNYLKINEQQHKDYNDKLLMINTKFSSGFPINGDYTSNLPSSSSSSSSSSTSSSSHRGSFSQIHPSVNISSLNESRRIMSMDMMSNMHIPRPFDMNMQVFDGRTLFEGNVLVPPLNSQEITRGSFPPNFGIPFHQHLHQQTLHYSSSSSPTHQVSLFSQASEGKRHNFLMATKASENASKKPRVESRSSCPPFKVRKEKLGDRVAALQQLVSPFGKTDTASVLMEAIGYIKFLQNQIETLSVPYMRASRNRPGKASQMGLLPQEGDEEEDTSDLRSRGLCLVPLSCMTYVTGDGGDGGGGGFWPMPPGFGGGN